MANINDLKTALKQQLTLNQGLVHCSNILSKAKGKKHLDVVEKVMKIYSKYLTAILAVKGYDDADIAKRVDLLNIYYDDFSPYETTFSAQSKWRSTILEEFCYILFKDYVDYVNQPFQNDINPLTLGPAKAYTNAYFRAKNLAEFVHDIQLIANEKNQDFAIYRNVNLTVDNAPKPIQINVPIFSIEVKTYIDKTMFEGIVATAEKIKNGNPYSRFYVITETYDVSSNVDPAYTRIDQIYVLRKSKRRQNNVGPIHTDVVTNLFHDVKTHMESPWYDLNAKLQSGTLI